MTPRGPGQTLFQFVRHWSRRPVAADASGEKGRLVLVCEAVQVLERRSVCATVNAVAQEIGIDQSGASRLIKNAAAAGCLTMTPSRTDARQREAALTPAGQSLLETAHCWQDRVFNQLTAGWSQQRRDDFHHAMTDLMERSWVMNA